MLLSYLCSLLILITVCSLCGFSSLCGPLHCNASRNFLVTPGWPMDLCHILKSLISHVRTWDDLLKRHLIGNLSHFHILRMGCGWLQWPYTTVICVALNLPLDVKKSGLTDFFGVTEVFNTSFSFLNYFCNKLDKILSSVL